MARKTALVRQILVQAAGLSVVAALTLGTSSPTFASGLDQYVGAPQASSPANGARGGATGPTVAMPPTPAPRPNTPPAPPQHPSPPPAPRPTLPPTHDTP